MLGEELKRAREFVMLGRHAEATVQYDSLVKTFPNSRAEILVEKANAYFACGDDAVAYQLLCNLWRDGRLRFDSIFLIGLIALQEDDIFVAIEAFQEVLKDDDDYFQSSASLGLSKALIAAQQSDQAIILLEAVSEEEVLCLPNGEEVTKAGLLGRES